MNGYIVEELPTRLRRYVPRRRTGEFSLPTTLAKWNSIADEFKMTDDLLTFAGLDEYVGCSNGEPSKRPIPEIFPVQETQALTDKVVPRLPALMAWLWPQVEAPWQSYQAVSRMGAPFYIPYDDKLFILKQLLPSFLRGDFSFCDGDFVQIGGRCQEEPLSKIREFSYITPDGEVYRQKLDRRQDEIRVYGHTRFPARYRNVFNQPIFNLLTQVVDTALHNVYLKHPAFHHDILNLGQEVSGPVRAIDVSRFERATARVVLARADAIGGVYGAFQKFMFNAPFLVMADDWRTPLLLRPDYKAGMMVQFGSGNSAVAASQKDIFMCLYASFAEEHLGVAPADSFNWVAGGGDDRVRIKNYGDDNFLFSPAGDAKLLDDIVAYLAQFLAVTAEEPAAFLGAVYSPDRKRFELSLKSYVAKAYLNERGPFPPFRRFPFAGLLERRELYIKYGDPVIADRIIPYEDKLWQQFGFDVTRLSEAANLERIALARENEARRAFFSNPAYLLGKADYMVDHKDKVLAGHFAGYTGFHPFETADIIKQSVAPENVKKAVKLNP